MSRPIDPPQETPPVFYSARQAMEHERREEQAEQEAQEEQEQQEQARVERGYQTWLATPDGQKYLDYCKRLGVSP